MEQKVNLEDNVFATITSEGTLVIEYVIEGPLSQDRARCIGISSVGAQVLLDLLVSGGTAQQRIEQMSATLETCTHGIPTTSICPRCGDQWPDDEDE